MCGNPAYTLFPVSGLKVVPGLIETYSHHKPTDQGLIGRRMIKEDSLTAFKENVQRSCDLVLGLGERKNSESVADYLHFCRWTYCNINAPIMI